jgi:two-component system, OmpR family, response regulator
MRILLIEDDRRLADLIAHMLQKAHYVVDVMHDGHTGLEAALQNVHQIAIIDWMLPGRDGPAICRAIWQARLPMALLLLTALGQVENRVAGLDSGADDYLPKPFAFEELLARVRSLSRRFTSDAADASELRNGELVLDLYAHTARLGNHALDLSKTEWNLLEFLLRHPDQALSRIQILDQVWAYDRDVQITMVDLYVSYLRRKLAACAGGEVYAEALQTVRGVGYRFVRKS